MKRMPMRTNTMNMTKHIRYYKVVSALTYLFCMHSTACYEITKLTAFWLSLKPFRYSASGIRPPSFAVHNNG